MWLPLLPCPFLGAPLGGVCTGVGGGKVCTNGSQTGAEKPADRKSPARLGDQMTRLTGVTERRRKLYLHPQRSSQELAHPAHLRASYTLKGSSCPGGQHGPDTQWPLRRLLTEGGRRRKKGERSVGSKDEKNPSPKCLGESQNV